MTNNIIRVNENLYLIRRILSESTTEEQATKIHHSLSTDTLLRNDIGKWFCCLLVRETEFKDIEIVKTEAAEDLSHTQFELNDNGGIG